MTPLFRLLTYRTPFVSKPYLKQGFVVLSIHSFFARASQRYKTKKKSLSLRTPAVLYAKKLNFNSLNNKFMQIFVYSLFTSFMEKWEI